MSRTQGMSTDSVTISAKKFDELEPVVLEVLERRRDEIKDGRLDGRHWFLAILAEARDLARRRETWQGRTE